jgi:hypothetical protein
MPLIPGVRPRHIIFLATLLLVGTLSVMLPRGRSRQKLILPFNPPDCFLPCMLGIVPGETGFNAAFQQLASTGADPGSHTHGIMFDMKARDGNTYFVVMRGSDPRLGRYVSQLIVYPLWHDKVTTLGEILGTGYIPVRVFRNRINGPGVVSLLLVFGEDQRIAAEVTGYGSVNSDSPVRSLIVFAKEDRNWRLGDYLMIGHWDHEIEWRGFAPMEAYLNQAPPDLQSNIKARRT